MMSLKDSGNYHYRNNDYVKAIKYYKESIAANPEEVAVYNNVAMAYFKLQNYKECLHYCDQALRLDPKYKKVLYRRMETLAILNRWVEAVVDGHHYLTLEDPKEASYSEAIKALAEYKAKLTEQSAPPENAKLSARKRSTIPQHLLNIKANIHSDGVGLLYLRECFKKVMDGLQLPLSTTDLGTVEEIKLAVCFRLLEVETPQNCVDLVDVVLPLLKSNDQKEQKIRLLRQKIDAAKTLKRIDVAMLALRELKLIDKSEAILREIAEFEVATDSESQQAKDNEEEKSCSNVIEESGNSKPIAESRKEQRALSATQEEEKHSEPVTPIDKKGQVKQPLPKPKAAPIKKASKREQSKSEQSKSAAPTSTSAPQTPLNEQTIMKRAKHLQKYRDFSDYSDLLHKLYQFDKPSFSQTVLEEISHFDCFSLLKSGMSAADKELLRKLLSTVPSALAKRYQ